MGRMLEQQVTEQVLVEELPEAVGGQMVIDVTAHISIDDSVGFAGIEIELIEDQMGNDITSKFKKLYPSDYSNLKDKVFHKAMDRLG